MHPAVLFNLFNRIDAVLETQLSQPREKPLNLTEVQKVLQTLQTIVNNKVNRNFFRSLDRLLEILRRTQDLPTIQYVLHIIILFFKSRETMQKKEYEYFESSLLPLFNLVKSYMHHQNLNNKSELNLCDYFRDDPGYPRYLASSKPQTVREVSYAPQLTFEFMHPSPLTTPYSITAAALPLDSPLLIAINESDIVNIPAI